jgi:hypothetical protein
MDMHSVADRNLFDGWWRDRRYAWEKSFMQRMMDIRSKEMGLYKKMFYLRAVNSGVMMSGPVVMSLATFLTMSRIGGVRDSALPPFLALRVLRRLYD